MLRNYLTTAFRNLLRHKGYTLINVTGLAVGMACCLLIFLYVRDELSYDRFHKKADRIYRVTSHSVQGGRPWAPIGPPVGPELERSIPEIEEVVRFTYVGGFSDTPVLQAGRRQFEEPDVLYADPEAFDVFTLPLLRGNPDKALSEPYTVVLTEETAQKYFGDEDPTGQTLTLNGSIDLTVTGVLQNLPSRTHLPFDVLVSMRTFYAERGDWVSEAKGWNKMWTYTLLGKGHSAEEVSRKLPSFVDQFFSTEGEKSPSEEVRLALQPLTDIHLHSNLEKEWRSNSDIAYVYLFSIIALFVLGIACINFVNLATARSADRAKEVGVRKTVGASRWRLIGQFLAESTLLAVLSAGLALLLAELALPLFRILSGKTLETHLTTDPTVLIGLLGAAIVVGLLAGSYPALVLSRFRPAQVLKGSFTTSSEGVTLRRGLVILQFSIAIALVASTMVVRDQMSYMQVKNMGFDKEHILSVRLSGTAAERPSQRETLKEELRRHEAVASVSMASDVPSKRFSVENFRLKEAPEQKSLPMRIAYGVDHHYLSTLGAEIVAGRDFSQARATDTSDTFILNEAAVEALGVSDPVGKELVWPSRSNEAGTIVGVVKNFHFASLHHEIEPLVIPLHPEVADDFLLVRTRPSKASEALEAVEGVWERIAPAAPLTYSFLDQNFDQLYRAEARLSKVVTVFSIIIILIACFGLLGLAALVVQQREKEIGVRKAVGATAAQIVGLLSKEFAQIVAVAFLIAVPIAYLGARRWLQDYAYHIDLGPMVFVLAGGLVLAIALAAVSIQTFRAAQIDPARTLRSE